MLLPKIDLQPDKRFPLVRFVRVLIERTTKAVGNNARFVEAGLEIKQRDGTPNWAANIGIAPTSVTKAFDEALYAMQSQYNIEW